MGPKGNLALMIKLSFWSLFVTLVISGFILLKTVAVSIALMGRSLVLLGKKGPVANTILAAEMQLNITKDDNGLSITRPAGSHRCDIL